MKHKYLDQAKQILANEYHLDVLEDIILSRPNRLVLFAEKADKLEDIEMTVVAGNLESIGFEDQPSIMMNDIIQKFDFHSKYSEVAGKKEYFEGIYQDLKNFKDQVDTTLPIINDGGRFWIRINSKTVENNKDVIAVFITDVTEFLVEEEEMFLKTHRDSLTGLFNKYTLDYHFGKRYKFEDLHIFYLDLDDFKIVNDIYGHKKGNQYLEKFGELLRSFDKDYNRFYRIGGDEFVGLFFEKEEKIKDIAKKILIQAREIAEEIGIKGTSVSIGIVKATRRDDVIRKADEVLYRAKELGKDRFLYEIEK